VPLLLALKAINTWSVYAHVHDEIRYTCTHLAFIIAVLQRHYNKCYMATLSYIKCKFYQEINILCINIVPRFCVMLSEERQLTTEITSLSGQMAFFTALTLFFGSSGL